MAIFRFHGFTASAWRTFLFDGIHRSNLVKMKNKKTTATIAALLR